MKKLALISILLTAGAAHAQDIGNLQFSLKSPLEQFKSNTLASLNVIHATSFAGPTDYSGLDTYSTGRGLMLKNSAQSSLSFSKNEKIQYGFRLEADQFFDIFSFEKKLEGKNDLPGITKFKTSAFLNYRISPDYNLTASITTLGGAEHGKLFSVSAKANKFFNRKHSLNTTFSLNWSNTKASPWSQFDQRLNVSSRSPADRFTVNPEVRLGATWNWSINTNWSLSTGISARHFMNDVNKNPFSPQRTPVTIFSVATYRF